jgi:hypothetical protein
MKRKNRRRKVNQPRGSRRSRHKKFAPLRNPEQLFAMPERTQDVYKRVTHAISDMRVNHVSRALAARKFGVSARQVQQFGGRALRKQRNGRYAAKSRDTLLRILLIVSLGGLEEIVVNDSRQATFIAKHSNAVHLYLRTGDAVALEEFQTKFAVDWNGKQVPLLTNLDDLERLGSAGNLSFESLYARAS